MNKKDNANVVYIVDGFCKNHDAVISNNVGEPGGHYVKFNTSDTDNLMATVSEGLESTMRERQGNIKQAYWQE